MFSSYSEIHTGTITSMASTGFSFTKLERDSTFELVALTAPTSKGTKEIVGYRATATMFVPHNQWRDAWVEIPIIGDPDMYYGNPTSLVLGLESLDPSGTPPCAHISMAAPTALIGISWDAMEIQTVDNVRQRLMLRAIATYTMRLADPSEWQALFTN